MGGLNLAIVSTRLKSRNRPQLLTTQPHRNDMALDYPDIHLMCCPITNGLQTTMTAHGFDRLCNYHRGKRPVKESLYLIASNNMFARCKECGGKDRPKELSIFGEEM
jgi:hypothetical protein